MSIKNAADLVRAQGRYGDSQLMHVTPKEVQALQTIAQAHGKSLSVNPNTGLPEAFDLGAILPTVAGTVVGSMVGMPWLGAAIGGLGTYATTGSLEKGLMAGLGAFGGASFGAALGAAGAGGAGAATGVAETAATTGIGELASAAAYDAGLAGVGGNVGAATSGAAMSPMQLAGAYDAGLSGVGANMPALSGAERFASMGAADKLSSMGSGIQNLLTNPAETWAGMGGIKGQGMNLNMMAAPLMSGAFNSTSTSSTDTEPKGDIRQYDYDPIGRRFAARPVVSARNFQGFQPSVFGYAEGGEVEPGVDEANRNQIAKFYRSYLGREPDAAGLDYWAQQMNAGASPQDILNSIKLSPEATGIQQNKALEDYYRDYLGRSPSASEMAGLQQSIQAGTPLDQVQQNIRQSQEAAGIAAAAQQRQQMFSPLPPAGPMVGQTPVQQTGIGMIPNRYQAPVNIPSQGVQDYNQLLANRANYEYNVMPMPQAMRPRTPAEQAAARDRQLIGQQMMLNAMLAAKPVVPPQNGTQGNSQYNQGYYAGHGGADGVGGATSDGTDGGMGGVGDAGSPGMGATADGVGSDGGDGGGDGGGGDGGGGDGSGGGFARGGAIGIMSAPKFQAGGEMESDAFVIPADVVSALGNGSTDAGVRKLNDYLGVALLIEGEGDGLSDDIPATIDGEQPARVADGEVYIPADIVAQLGEGDPEEGAEMLYELIDKVRQAAHGKKTQQREVDLNEVMPE